MSVDDEKCSKSGEKRGPKPKRLKIKGKWKGAISESLEKERPEGGWPEPEKKKDKD